MNESPAPDQTPLLPVPPAQPPERLPLLRRMNPVAYVVLVLGVIFFLYQIVGGGITFLLSRGGVTEMNVTLMRWMTLAGQVVLILVPTLLLTRARYPDIKNFLRLNVPDYREIIASTIAVFALQQLLQVYMLLQDAIPLPPELQKLIEYIQGSDRPNVPRSGDGQRSSRICLCGCHRRPCSCHM